MTTVTVGTALDSEISFVDSAGAADDPDAVFCQWRQPDGTVVSREYNVSGGAPEIEKVSGSVSTYRMSIDTTGKPGLHKIYWRCTGSPQFALKDEFYAEASGIS